MSDAPSNGDMEIHETFSIASEFAPSVTLTEETFFEHGWQPLTICVLQAIWFLPADASFDVAMLVDWFKQLGWRSANGKPLGPDAIRRELGLIRKAGYINAVRLQGEGGRMVGIHYTVSKRRSNSPQDGIPVRPADQETRRSRHVPSFTTHGGPPHVVDEGNRRSRHVPSITGRGDSPHMADGRPAQVAPCASNGVHPPLPPGGGGGSSPYPLNDDAQPQQEEKAPSVEELAATVDFLQELPDPWVIGEKDAKQIAPELLAQMLRKEWPSILDVDRQLLVIPLTANPGGMTNPVSILRHKRVPNLPAYSRVAARAAKKSSAPAEGKCPRHPAFVDGDCSPCRIAERERAQRGKSDPAGVNGAGLLARLRAAQTNS